MGHTPSRPGAAGSPAPIPPDTLAKRAAGAPQDEKTAAGRRQLRDGREVQLLKSEFPLLNGTRRRAAGSVQLPLEVAVDPHALLHGDKGVGVDGVDGVEQLLDLVLGKAHAQHVIHISTISASKSISLSEW